MKNEMRKYCPKCDTFVPVKIVLQEETYSIKGESFSVKAKVAKCAECGESLCDDDLDWETQVTLYNLYRKRHGLLMPEEMTEIRKKYDLSQTLFARILGLGAKTITRYENGALQDEAQNNLICLMKQTRNFQMLYERKKNDLTKKERQQIDEVLNSIMADSIITIGTASPYSYKPVLQICRSASKSNCPELEFG